MATKPDPDDYLIVSPDDLIVGPYKRSPYAIDPERRRELEKLVDEITRAELRRLGKL
jgi:CRISPR/Cas system-associated exonuclease Cas4 (RecB family)